MAPNSNANKTLPLTSLQQDDEVKIPSACPSSKARKAIQLKNYLTNEIFYDTLHHEADRVS